MRKLNVFTCLSMCAAVFCVAGCYSLGHDNATDAEMAAAVVPTYPSPAQLPAISSCGKDALVGEWSGTVWTDSKSVIPRFRRVIVQPGSSSRQTYKLFRDGQYLFSNKGPDGNETLSNGNWIYENGYLTVSEPPSAGKPGHSMKMRVVWYAPNHVEFRIDDIRQYENLFKQAPSVQSVSALYDLDGSLRTDMHFLNNGTAVIMKMIQSPLRFTRVGDVN